MTLSFFLTWLPIYPIIKSGSPTLFPTGYLSSYPDSCNPGFIISHLPEHRSPLTAMWALSLPFHSSFSRQTAAWSLQTRVITWAVHCLKPCSADLYMQNEAQRPPSLQLPSVTSEPFSDVHPHALLRQVFTSVNLQCQKAWVSPNLSYEIVAF